MKEIKHISDLITHLNDDIDKKNHPIWFRGHSDASWKLTSAYDRLKKPPPESSLVKEFRQNASYLLDKQPKSDFDWLFLMQHYGVPTRLLDWSESPLVGLYFAVAFEPRKNLKKDGALWVLFPNILNSNTNKTGDEYIPAFEDSEYMESYTTEKYDKGRDKGVLPIAAIATRNNPRIQAQLGVFTISHNANIPIENIGDKSHIIKYLIPKDFKKIISHELELLALEKFQLFPELSCIGEKIKAGLK